MSTQGHVQTTDNDTDNNSLLLVFLLDKQQDVNALQKELNEQVQVLRDFATDWNKGTKDIKGSSPLSGSSPCEVLVVIKQQHLSSITPNERVHITVKPAKMATWTATPPSAKGVVHVYSKNNITANGYESYWIQNTKGTNFGSAGMQAAITAAMGNAYQ